MDSEFGGGFLCGILMMIVVTIIVLTCKHSAETNGYKDKMVIEYHCPDREYERQLFLDMVNGSGIQTNFVNKEVTMDKHTIRFRLMNPK